MSLGPSEILLIILLIVLLFGAGRLSSIGKGLGEGIKNFKDALEGDEEKKKEEPKEPKLLVAGEPKPAEPAAKETVPAEKKPEG
jgi:sec-independent protein translocase protein TatA